jgi:KUP system potassium uptake protein
MAQSIQSNPGLEPHCQTPAEESRETARGSGFPSMAFGSLGIVYGDIGTSPLYAFQEAAKQLGKPSADGIYGAVSLILWTLTIIVTLKYVLLVLRNDNEGEGGLLTLATLANKDRPQKLKLVLVLGLVGAALFYGDAAITPAISVMSAVGGLAIIMPKSVHFVMPVSFAILCALFMIQKKGTQKVAWMFGPVMAVWMLVMAAAAIPQIVGDPHILTAASPLYGLHYLARHGIHSLGLLAMVFLAVTGAEALYADLGHFGRAPIRLTWLFLVFPCLALSYLGQASLLLHHPEAIKNPFVLLAPHWALWPVVILGMLATVIASQAVITGAYSLTSQAFELGLLPRMKIICTSGEKKGQIYIPLVNKLLMIAVLLVVLIFRDSHGAAAAYGIAVSGTMLTNSILTYLVIRKEWKWNAWASACLMTPFILTEMVFLSANATKILHGGYVPLFFALFMILLMTCWTRGMRALRINGQREATPFDKLTSIRGLMTEKPNSGAAVFLTRYPGYLSKPLLQRLEEEKMNFGRFIIASVIIQHVPKVPDKDRFEIRQLAPGLTSVAINLGYIEKPDLPRLLANAPSLNFDAGHACYFLTRRVLSHRRPHSLSRWQARIFAALKKRALTAQEFYCLPEAAIVTGEEIAI